MANSEKDTLLEESDNIKKFEKQVLESVSKCKNNFRQVEKLNDALKKKIKNLSKTRANTIAEIELKAYSKSSIANDIFTLRELSEQINSVCSKIKALLEVCSKHQQQSINNIEKLEIKFIEQKKTSDQVLKSKKEVIENIRKDIENNTRLISEEQNKFAIELNNLRKLQKQKADECKLLLEANQHFREENAQYNNEIDTINQQIKDLSIVLIQKQQLKESLTKAVEENKVNSENILEDLTNQINTLSTKLENANTNAITTKKIVIEQQNGYEALLIENVKLEYECKYYEDKSTELKVALNTEENEYLQKCTVLNNDLELLNKNIFDKEGALSNAKILNDETKNDFKIIENNLEEQLINNKQLENDVNNLKANTSSLLQSISETNEIINQLTIDLSKSDETISNINLAISETNSKKSSCDDEYKNSIDSLKKEIEYSKSNFNTTCEDLEAKKLKCKQSLELELLTKQEEHNQEYKKRQNEGEEIETLMKNLCEEKKQAEINLASKTLECDILMRKVVNTEGVRDSLSKELKPKPVKIPVVPRKRQADESSESSYDGGLTLKQHLLRKKMMKRAKRSSLMKN